MHCKLTDASLIERRDAWEDQQRVRGLKLLDAERRRSWNRAIVQVACSDDIFVPLERLCRARGRGDGKGKKRKRVTCLGRPRLLVLVAKDSVPSQLTITALVSNLRRKLEGRFDKVQLLLHFIERGSFFLVVL